MTNSGSEKNPIKLDKDLCFKHIKEIHHFLSENIVTKQQITISLDLSDVQAIDSAGIQLLCHVNNSLNNKKRRLRLLGMNPSVKTAIMTTTLLE